jgi:hypothetical protein
MLLIPKFFFNRALVAAAGFLFANYMSLITRLHAETSNEIVNPTNADQTNPLLSVFQTLASSFYNLISLTKLLY